MQQADEADLLAAIDPDTACIGCGQDSSPETMVICDSCQLGFHTACFGMPAVPDADTWHCRGCTVLRELAAGQQIVTESPQLLYPGTASGQPHYTLMGAENAPHSIVMTGHSSGIVLTVPHGGGAYCLSQHTQGLYTATIIHVGLMQHDATGCSRQARVQSSLAQLPGSVRFYSCTPPHKQLHRVPQQSQQLSERLLQQSGASAMDVTLARSRYGMFGTAADLSTEAWIAGPACADEALRILAGTPKQAFICSNSVSSNSSNSSNTAAGFSKKIPQQQHPAPSRSVPAQRVGLSAACSAQASVVAAALEPASAAVLAGKACVGCNTYAAGRPMQLCGECKLWSCSAPCRPAAAGDTTFGRASRAGGRPLRQGAGLMWSCPNPGCGSALLEPQHPSAVPAPEPSSPVAHPQQPSPDPPGPSPMLPPGHGASPQQPVCSTGQPADPAQL